jgi:ribosome-associated protein
LDIESSIPRKLIQARHNKEITVKDVPIWSEFITLGQLIKMLDYVGSGAEVKSYLGEHMCVVNDENENRRGKKLRPGDLVVMPDGRKYKITIKG